MVLVSRTTRLGRSRFAAATEKAPLRSTQQFFILYSSVRLSVYTQTYMDDVLLQILCLLVSVKVEQEHFVDF